MNQGGIPRWPTRFSMTCLAAVLAWGLLCCGVASQAQENPILFHRADQPPGSVAYGQLQRNGLLAGHYQPVKIVLPGDTSVSLLRGNGFGAATRGHRTVGMMIGPVYRLKVTGIPGQEGREIFPTVELVNRLYTPEGLESKFPVPIHITAEELLMALEGKFVTRVIYLEDPHSALPVAEQKNFQRYFDVGANQDPLQTADRLGRPIAILRMGSRVPQMDPTGKFYYQSPPWVEMPEPAAGGSGQPTDNAIERSQAIPREPIGQGSR